MSGTSVSSGFTSDPTPPGRPLVHYSYDRNDTCENYSEDKGSDKHSDNDDIISNEIEKFHVNTLATPQDFYENGTSKRYRRENDGGVLGLNNGAWNDWDPVRKSKSSSFLVDVEGGGGEKGNYF